LLLSAILSLCCATLFAGTPRVTRPEVGANQITAKEVSLKSVSVDYSKSETAPIDRNSLPDAPTAKALVNSNSDDALGISSSTSGSPAIQPVSNPLLKNGGDVSLETPRERGIWYGLMAVSHGAAAFDAYSTRRAISGNYGVEGNPLLRPFSHSNAMYAATQVSPAIMDYIGHRMLKSHNTLIHRFWWLPQTAGGSVSLAAGIHNYRLVP
jgi:hypothetical protein